MTNIEKRRYTLKIRGLIFCLCILATTITTACAQRNLTELVGEDKIAIEFQHTAKGGETRKYLIDPRNVPNAGAIPTMYGLIGEKAYYVNTKTIDLGDPIVSFAVPINNEEDFKKVRVMRLTPNHLLPGGYEWKDCTISLKLKQELRAMHPTSGEAEFNQSFNERFGEHLPDFMRRRIACEVRDGLKSDEYYALVLQARPDQTRPSLKVDLALSSATTSASGKEVTYNVNFTNTGEKDIGEFNISSAFTPDVSFLRVEPGQGSCRDTRSGTAGGDTVCHLGALPRGKTIAVKFVGSPSGMTITPGKLNRGWRIQAVILEHPGDLILDSDRSSFYPLDGH